MKNLSILGSTGSIGLNTLKVARHLKDKFRIVALAAKSNIDLLEQQALEFHPELVCVYDEKMAMELKRKLPHVEVVTGLEGLQAVATHGKAEMVISAMTGTRGLAPTVAAIQAGKNVGLANKESLVSGGELIMSLIKKNGVHLLPIDSEHSALFQCLNGEDPKKIYRMILTASGGPFRAWSSEQLAQISVEQALAHPTWNMGPKVTIDCSTLMNKGLEAIEAHWLFSIPMEQIEVVIHPQSLIHSMIEFTDGSIMAQMGEPNMIVPIQYAMTYPERHVGMLAKFDFTRIHEFQFYPPDFKKFRCLSLAFEAIRQGGSLPCYMNAANETLVSRFLNKEIGWQDISNKLEKMMSAHPLSKVNTLEDVLAIDEIAREEAKKA
ncbi:MULTISPECIES: 1-deoxy-D-xylulose-5-phosphate reductoisomerase [unclassified Neochlamydia]|uniref:1-deoxy-D-xylulose-5-phosphate reductoisomerase n=1 Tax=unclassified Neochlamydia TaxID=2643326 RepID=UPI00140DF752|nr:MULTISPECIES: 1-deoxy-D-xylulose-5-phosphate reductoisomerase [unclassified Neochlamydia]